MRERVRGLLVTPGGELLTIRRERPDMPAYWVLPGGHVEPDDASLEDALRREAREELAANIEIDRLVYVLEAADDRQLFYLARATAWSATERTGPEFADPSRGQYVLEAVPLAAAEISAIALKPREIAEFLIQHLRDGCDLFDLPDLRDIGMSTGGAGHGS